MEGKEAAREEVQEAATAAMEPARHGVWLVEAAEAGKPTAAGGGAALGKAATASALADRLYDTVFFPL